MLLFNLLLVVYFVLMATANYLDQPWILGSLGVVGALVYYFVVSGTDGDVEENDSDDDFSEGELLCEENLELTPASSSSESTESDAQESSISRQVNMSDHLTTDIFNDHFGATETLLTPVENLIPCSVVNSSLPNATSESAEQETTDGQRIGTSDMMKLEHCNNGDSAKPVTLNETSVSNKNSTPRNVSVNTYVSDDFAQTAEKESTNANHKRSSSTTNSSGHPLNSPGASSSGNSNPTNLSVNVPLSNARPEINIQLQQQLEVHREPTLRNDNKGEAHDEGKMQNVLQNERRFRQTYSHEQAPQVQERRQQSVYGNPLGFSNTIHQRTSRVVNTNKSHPGYERRYRNWSPDQQYNFYDNYHQEGSSSSIHQRNNYEYDQQYNFYDNNHQEKSSSSTHQRNDYEYDHRRNSNNYYHQDRISNFNSGRSVYSYDEPIQRRYVHHQEFDTEQREYGNMGSSRYNLYDNYHQEGSSSSAHQRNEYNYDHQRNSNNYYHQERISNFNSGHNVNRYDEPIQRRDVHHQEFDTEQREYGNMGSSRDNLYDNYHQEGSSSSAHQRNEYNYDHQRNSNNYYHQDRISNFISGHNVDRYDEPIQRRDGHHQEFDTEQREYGNMGSSRDNLCDNYHQEGSSSSAHQRNKYKYDHQRNSNNYYHQDRILNFNSGHNVDRYDEPIQRRDVHHQEFDTERREYGNIESSRAYERRDFRSEECGHEHHDYDCGNRQLVWRNGSYKMVAPTSNYEVHRYLNTQQRITEMYHQLCWDLNKIDDEANFRITAAGARYCQTKKYLPLEARFTDVTERLQDWKGFAGQLQHNIHRCNYSSPTPIQSVLIPQILAGKDVMAKTETGAGKTAAVGIPIVQRILQVGKAEREYVRRNRCPFAIILADTKELAQQLFECFSMYTNGTGVTICIAYGGMKNVIETNGGGCEILIGSSGRIGTLIEKREIDLQHMRFFVIDEAGIQLRYDAMRNLQNAGLRSILESAQFKSASNYQSICLSAEYCNADAARTAMESIRDQTKQTIERCVEITESGHRLEAYQRINLNVPVFFWDTETETRKMKKLEILLRMEDGTQEPKKTIIFVHDDTEVEHLVERLTRARHEVACVHGRLSTEDREANFYAFKTSLVHILITTSSLSRGIEIPDLQQVVLFNMNANTSEGSRGINSTNFIRCAGTVCRTREGEVHVLLQCFEKHNSKIARYLYELCGSQLVKESSDLDWGAISAPPAKFRPNSFYYLKYKNELREDREAQSQRKY